MLKIQYKKAENDVWYREYSIYINDNYQGWICKYRKTDKEFDIFSSKLHITVLNNNNSFKTLKEAKEFIRKQAEFYFMGAMARDRTQEELGIDDNTPTLDTSKMLAENERFREALQTIINEINLWLPKGEVKVNMPHTMKLIDLLEVAEQALNGESEER